MQTPAYAAKYAPHIKLDALARTITSRCLVDTRNLAYGQERLFLQQVKDILAAPKMQNVTAYHSAFQLGSARLPDLLMTLMTYMCLQASSRRTCCR